MINVGARLPMEAGDQENGARLRAGACECRGLAIVGLVYRLLPMQIKRNPNAHPAKVASCAMGPAIAR